MLTTGQGLCKATQPGTNAKVNIAGSAVINKEKLAVSTA